jgi:hypothetical protein
MRWAWLTFCTAAFLAAFFMRPASAEMYCFPSLEVAKGELAKHGETFRFSVVMKVGALAHVYAGKQTMTILVEQPNGMVCTGPALIGDIVKNAEDTCA